MTFKHEREVTRDRRSRERKVKSILRRIGGAGDGFVHRSLGILEELAEEDTILAAKVFSEVKGHMPECVRDTVQMAIMHNAAGGINE